MSDAQDMMAIFLDIYSGLPRQGPGSVASTQRALVHCELPERATIADIGCGPGMQTLTLAQRTNAPIFALDYHLQYLEELRQSRAKIQPDAQISLQQADMNYLPFAPASLDMIWSEGAVYIMGVAEALKNWKMYLKPRGYLVFSEVAWIKDDPPDAIVDYWTSEYPQMGTIEEKLSVIKASGYDVIHHFTLPDDDWWANYYTPLAAKLADSDRQYADNLVGLEIIAGTRHEIAMRRHYGQWYSYEFFVCRLPR